MNKKIIIPILVSCLAIIHLSVAEITLEKGNFRIVVPENADEQVMLAAKTLAKDIEKVMGFTHRHFYITSKTKNHSTECGRKPPCLKGVIKSRS